MKLLAIPDVHGTATWKFSANKAVLSGDTHIVFLGDYADGYDIKATDCIFNLKQIIAFKKIYPTKVTLLLGNHDLAYVFEHSSITGYDPMFAYEYRMLFQENWNLFDIAWGYEDKAGQYTLLTHAGLTQQHYESISWDIEDERTLLHKVLVEYGTVDWKTLPLHDLLNYLKEDDTLLWEIGRARKGDYPVGSVVWADRNELVFDPYPGINQIVGHTCGPGVEIVKSRGNTLYFTDNWGRLPLAIEL